MREVCMGVIEKEDNKEENKSKSGLDTDSN
jgi:hypothetical protein